MKISILSVGIALLAAMPLTHAESVSDRTNRPCFRVNIQNDRVNESNVQQNCEWNFNRTVQAGSHNQAQTSQQGTINNNKVRQYQYDVPGYSSGSRDDR